MAPGTDDPKDLGDKKIGNAEKQSDVNEGFSGENLPKNYNPSKDKLDMELEKTKNGTTVTQQRARDVDEKQAPPVDSRGDDTTRADGKKVDKSRGTANEKEAMETAENRDFNSDIEKGRDNKDETTVRGNTHFGG
ncbi:hypothetical protein ACLI09_06300 [Flavobacterium sp. RHBU_24]|uniref:hypothetical protein n=1 Tax=Flavobacterium sp. RHBU_24 TaxID=3391185 RepID=UPI0039850067